MRTSSLSLVMIPTFGTSRDSQNDEGAALPLVSSPVCSKFREEERYWSVGRCPSHCWGPKSTITALTRSAKGVFCNCEVFTPGRRDVQKQTQSLRFLNRKAFLWEEKDLKLCSIVKGIKRLFLSLCRERGPLHTFQGGNSTFLSGRGSVATQKLWGHLTCCWDTEMKYKGWGEAKRSYN